MTRPRSRSRPWPLAACSALAAGLAAAALLAPPLPAAAVVPTADRVRAEIARANAQAGRARPLWLDVALVDDSGAIAGTGRALLGPGGVARLELRLADGRLERHERTPAGYLASRDGLRLERSLPLLPPIQLLQAPSEAELAAALVGIGAEPERVDLGMTGDADCWVLGGRDPGPFDASRRPSLWFDLAARRPVRIDDAGGTRFDLGPPTAGGPGVSFPAWIAVRAPGWPLWRLQVQQATPAPPGARLDPP